MHASVQYSWRWKDIQSWNTNRDKLRRHLQIGRVLIFWMKQILGLVQVLKDDEADVDHFP